MWVLVGGDLGAIILYWCLFIAVPWVTTGKKAPAAIQPVWILFLIIHLYRKQRHLDMDKRSFSQSSAFPLEGDVVHNGSLVTQLRNTCFFVCVFFGHTVIFSVCVYFFQGQEFVRVSFLKIFCSATKPPSCVTASSTSDLQDSQQCKHRKCAMAFNVKFNF